MDWLLAELWVDYLGTLVLAGIYTNRNKRLAAVTITCTVVSASNLHPHTCLCRVVKSHVDYYSCCRCYSLEHLSSAIALDWTAYPHPKVIAPNHPQNTWADIGADTH